VTGDELRSWMKERGWSVNHLAVRIPVHPRSVRRWLSGDRGISPAMSERIRSLRANARKVTAE
jgi:plasmid maintenance system antidote protein VapI